MTKFILRIMLLLALAAVLGCGGGGGDETQVAVHDCDGDCGMKAVPMDKLTLVDGKYLCAGCVHKAEAQKQGGDHADDGHSGGGH